MADINGRNSLLAASPSSYFLLSGSYDHTARLFDTRLDKSVMSFSHGQPVEAVLMFPTGGLCFSAGEFYRLILVVRVTYAFSVNFNSFYMTGVVNKRLLNIRSINEIVYPYSHRFALTHRKGLIWSVMLITLLKCRNMS